MVRRAIFDEAHGGFTDRYRTALTELDTLGPLALQKIWLSGSMPHDMIADFWKLLGQDPTTRVIRAPVYQRQLSMHRAVIGTNHRTSDFCDALMEYLSAEEMAAEDQGMIFLNTKANVDEFYDRAKANGTSISRSHADRSDRATEEQDWMDGKTKWVVSTATLLHGINNPRCTQVLVVNWDPGLLKLTQAWGRGGRRGQRTLVFLVGPRRSPQRESEITQQDFECFKQSAVCFANTTECMRKVFTLKYNGVEESCADIEGAELCGMCDPEGRVARKVRDLLPPIPDATPAGWGSSSRGGGGTSSGRQPVASATYARTSVQPSMSVELDAAYSRDILRGKREVCHLINEMATGLKGYCSGCWASTGKLFAKHAKHINECQGDHAARWAGFIDFKKALQYPAGEYVCRWCGLPTADDFRHPDHKRLTPKAADCGQGWSDLAKFALYVIHHAPAVWAVIIGEFPHVRRANANTPPAPQLAKDMSAVEWGRWCGQKGIYFTNGIEVMAWLWHERRRLNKEV